MAGIPPEAAAAIDADPRLRAEAISYFMTCGVLSTLDDFRLHMLDFYRTLPPDGQAREGA